MPRRRQSSCVGVPDSCSLIAVTIYSSVNRLFRMRPPCPVARPIIPEDSHLDRTSFRGAGHMLAQSCPIDAKAPNIAEAFMTSTMPTMWPGVMNSLRTLNGGRWEIVSHNATRVGPQMLMTFVLRRPA